MRKRKSEINRPLLRRDAPSQKQSHTEENKIPSSGASGSTPPRPNMLSYMFTKASPNYDERYLAIIQADPDKNKSLWREVFIRGFTGRL